jgi:sulfatase maturation enzyme AslB (radical SAM superfamily)
VQKFSDPKITAKGETRASVELTKLKTLWFNTGTLCNLSCENCYIESSPKNDRLSYLSVNDVKPFMDEVKSDYQDVELIGLTGGEPFLNPNIISILDEIMSYGQSVLVLTNAYRVMNKHLNNLIELNKKYPDQLFLRISLDHYTQAVHERERGARTFDGTLNMMQELYELGFKLSIAGRSLTSETMDEATKGYQDLLNQGKIGLKLTVGDNLVIFPEMIMDENVPEITTDCWDILNKSPDDQMCATERMIVRRKDSKAPVVLPCTLLAYDTQFELGNTLKEAQTVVPLNHVFCAKFCVLGGASCSSAK